MFSVINTPKYSISILSERNRRKSDQRIARLTKFLYPGKSLLRICSTLYGQIMFLKWLLDCPPSRKTPSYRHFSTRQELWIFIVEKLRHRDIGYVLEFGVANGDGTRFWLANLNDIAYHGFDCFTGMPENYRQVPKGVFDLNGHPPPQISDTRVIWHIGLVQETLLGFEIPSDRPKLVLFDLDLYGPTSFALKKVIPHLRHSDLIFFDEAWDDAEGVVARDFFAKSKNMRLMASATGCMVLEFIGED
jgi:hypothetical protein